MGMLRARLQVPHGGAANTPKHCSACTHCQKSDWPLLVVKSAVMTFATLLLRMWSTPKEAVSPRKRRQAVTRAEPANISIMKGCDGAVG